MKVKDCGVNSPCQEILAEMRAVNSELRKTRIFDALLIAIIMFTFSLLSQVAAHFIFGLFFID